MPAEDPTGHWEGEETLDVEWAHAMAPGAKIDIIEVNDDSNWPTNLLAGDKLAASLPGVSAISNSWGLTRVERRDGVRFLDFRDAERSHGSDLPDRQQ